MTTANFAAPQTAAEMGIGLSPTLPPQQRADYENWSLAPYNRWSFQRVQQFTRTIRVPRAAEPSVLEEDRQDLSDIVFEDTDGRQCTVKEMLSRTYTDGFLVLHRGKVLTEQYFNGMSAATLHLIMSCSKSITSTVAGIYIEAGVLDPSAPLTDYLPELAETGMAGASLQQALDMQVGVKFSEDYDDLDADWRQYEVATGWREAPGDYDGPLDQIAYAKTLTEKESEHGTIFHYQSVLTNAIGICLERATGRHFAELLAEHIWNPIGTEQDLVSIIDSAGNMAFEGGFNVCLRDFARFGRLIASHGRHEEQQLVPKRWLNGCRNPDDKLITAFAASEYADAAPGGAYHNQWWVRDASKGILMALGIHGQTAYVDAERDFVVAKFSSQPDQADVAMAVDQMLAFEAIADTVA